MVTEGRTVVLAMTLTEARAAWHALGVTVDLIDQVGCSSQAPLYGMRDMLAATARRLDHEINHMSDPEGMNDGIQH